MKTHSNDGIRKVYWTMAMCLIVLMVLGTVLWWYDYHWLEHH